MSFFERQGRENCIAAIALQRAIPHGRCIAQVEAERLSRFHHILLLTELRYENPTGASGRQGWYRRIASVRFLDEYNEWRIGIGAVVDQVTVPDAGDNLAQPPPADPDIPAQHHQASIRGTVRS
jgi:hypothetical protein